MQLLLTLEGHHRYPRPTAHIRLGQTASQQRRVRLDHVPMPLKALDRSFHINIVTPILRSFGLNIPIATPPVAVDHLLHLIGRIAKLQQHMSAHF